MFATALVFSGSLYQAVLAGAVLCYPFAAYAVVHDDEPTTVLFPQPILIGGAIAGLLVLLDVGRVGTPRAIMYGASLALLVFLPAAAYSVVYGTAPVLQMLDLFRHSFLEPRFFGLIHLLAAPHTVRSAAASCYSLESSTHTTLDRFSLQQPENSLLSAACFLAGRSLLLALCWRLSLQHGLPQQSLQSLLPRSAMRLRSMRFDHKNSRTSEYHIS